MYNRLSLLSFSMTFPKYLVVILFITPRLPTFATSALEAVNWMPMSGKKGKVSTLHIFPPF